MFLEFLVVLLFGFQTSAKHLPPNFPRCCVDDPKMNDCLLNATTVLKPYIRKGIKEIGIPSYDPLIISFSGVQESDALNFTGVIDNFTVRGMDNYEITEIQYDHESMTFKGKFEFNPLSIHTHYFINGKVLFIPVLGNGTAQLAMGPINGTFEITGEIRKHKDVEHYHPADVKIKLTIDDASLYLYNLFDGNLELETLTNDLLNRNSKMVMKAVTPFFERVSETFIMRYFKWLTKMYPYYELLPHCKS